MIYSDRTKRRRDSTLDAFDGGRLGRLRGRGLRLICGPGEGGFRWIAAVAVFFAAFAALQADGVAQSLSLDGGAGVSVAVNTNSYSGAFLSEEGGTLIVENAGASSVTAFSGGTYTLGNGGVVLESAAGGTTFNLGASTVTLGLAGDYLIGNGTLTSTAGSGATLSEAGGVLAIGTLSDSGTGTLTLLGSQIFLAENTTLEFTGNEVITGSGAILTGTAGAIAVSNLGDAGALGHLSASSLTLVTSGSLTTVSSGSYLIGSTVLTLTGGTAPGASPGAEPANLVKSGTTDLIFTGTDDLGTGALIVKQGTFTIASGGSVSDQYGFIGPDGNVIVTGTGSKWVGSGVMQVGSSGTGTLLVSGGGAVSDKNGSAGQIAGSRGNVTVTGSGSTWKNAADLFVGVYGAGTLLISNGAAVSDQYGFAGYYGGSSGNVSVTGRGSTWTTGGTLKIGTSGAGTLLISGGGVVSDENGAAGQNAGSNGNVTVAGSGSMWMNAGDLFVGNSGDGTLLVTGSGLVSNYSGFIGENGGSSGDVTVTGSDSKWTGSHLLEVGGAGAGRLLVSGGGLASDNNGYVGVDAGGNGNVTVTGAGSVWKSGADVYIGASGTGTLLVSDGGLVFDNNGSVGGNAGSSGIVSVTGSGSKWTNGRYLFVGGDGAGTLLISSGGIVSTGTSDYDSTVNIGAGAGSQGNVTVTGPGSTWTDNGELFVGDSGTGTLLISSGGGVSTEDAYLGEYIGSSGMVTVTGPGSTWSHGLLYVGEYGTGALQITDGGAVTSDELALCGIGDQAGSNGMATVSGPGSIWSLGGGLAVGNYGTGTLVISDGGTVSSGYSFGNYIGYQAGSSGMVTVTGSGSLWTFNGVASPENIALYVGESGTGTLLISNGGEVVFASYANFGGGGYIGDKAGSSGAVTVTGSGSAWTQNAELFVGNAGTGALVISNGGAVSVSAFVEGCVIGDNAGSKGMVTVTGPGSVLNLDAPLVVGEAGTGTLQISDGGAVSNTSGNNDLPASIGDSAGSSGMVTVTGSGSLWTNNGDLNVGNSGTGTLLISSGGGVSTEDAYIGENAGASGAVTVTGSGSTWKNVAGTGLWIGYSGTGTMAVNGGGAVSDSFSFIGVDKGSNGMVTVSGSGSAWTDADEFEIGYSGAGTLAITNGGSVVDGYGVIGNQAGSSGMVTVTGTGSTWTSDGLVFGDAALSIGESGTGVLTITDGGVVSTTGPTTIGSGGTLQFDGLSPLHTGSLTVNGGTLRTLGAAAFTSPATLGAGGMTVDSDGFDSNFIGNFSGVGGITKVGMGTLTLMSASSYTGATAVNAGTLALVTPYASLGNTAITVAQGATFAVNGGFGPSESAAAPMAPPAGVVATINPGPPQIVNAGTTGSGTAGATLTLKPGSTFSMAGSAIATFNLQQEASFSGPAFTIGGASGIAPILIFGIGNENAGTDLINVTKTVSLLATGGEIAIDPLAGDTSLTAGNYDLITSAGGFSGVGGNGFTLSDPTDVIDGTTYDFSLADSSTTAEVLTVSVAASPDIAPESAEGFARVPERQGVTPLAATAAVPEPGATMSLLLALGVAGGWILRRGRD